MRRQLAIGKDRLYALRDKQGNIAHNMDAVVKVVERSYTRLYANDVRPGETTESTTLAAMSH